MAIILPRKGGFGETLGAATGYGLQNLLQGLGTGLEQRGQSKGFEQGGLPGVLALLDPQVQAAYLKEYGATQAENQRNNLLEQVKAGGLGAPSMERREELMPRDTFDEAMGIKGTPGEQPKEAAAGIEQAQAEKVEPGAIKAPKVRSREYRLTTENENLLKALENPQYNASAKALFRQEIERNEEQLQKIREYRDKKFGKELGGIRSEFLSAKEQKEDLNRLKELEDEGLISNKLASFLEGAGLDIPALKNPQSEEFDKIIANNLRNARQYFGGKITDYEIRSFLKTLPSLLNSPEGRNRVISQLERLNDLKIAAYKTAEKVIQKNKGIAPDNLWEKVDSKLDKQREAISEKFKRDLKRKVPAAENRLGVAASYIAGKALPALGGAGLGFALGGPVGAARGFAGGAAVPFLRDLLSGLGRNNQ